MKFPLLGLALAATTLCGCSHTTATVAADSSPKPPPSQVAPPAPSPQTGFDNGLYRGFDRNDYPGDATMAALHNTFAFTGYWLTVPPGETANTWTGKRDLLRRQGWGFLVLANGRLDAEILKSQKHGTTPAQLAQQDAATAVASANSEGFPPQTILFLDQEEGGRLLAEQAAYLLAWTESVAATGFRPGVYASGQPVEDGPGQHITTIEDIRTRVQTGHLHSIAIFDAQDTWPPPPRLHPPPQTPRRQRPRQPSSLAILPIPPPPRAHPILQNHLRPRRQLLRPQLPNHLPRHGRRHHQRSIPRSLEQDLARSSTQEPHGLWRLCPSSNLKTSSL
jgi:hypothetical protein